MEKDPETFGIIGAAMDSLEQERLVFGSSENLCKSAKSVDEIYL